jgi:hypothetical protein
MSFGRVSLLAVGSLVIAAVVVAGAPTGAAPKVGAPASRVPTPQSGAHRAWPGSHLRSHALPAPATPIASPARIPHVDPQLQVLPASANGTIEVALHGTATALAAAVAKVGGRSTASVDDAMTAVVPRGALATLAGTAGVKSVDKPVRAYADAISEGVAASKASVWQSAGQGGAGVKVGIVDVGFANLSAEIAAGNLPADTTLTDDCAGGNATTDHGTAVAEIVHQMAPAAQLYLYCISTTIGFKAAEQQIEAAGIKIVNSSLSFPGDSRGDGTGDDDSAATTVKTARKAGILWIQSAGDNGEDHWSGTFKDRDHDGYADLNGTGCSSIACHEWDGVFVPGHASAELVLKWDEWPTVSAPVPLTFYAWGSQCSDADCTSESVISATPYGRDQQVGAPPVLTIDINNTSAFYQEWQVRIEVSTGVPAVHYDLSYWGSVTNNYLSTLNPSRAAAGSVTEPANSPYALAVGAANVHSSTVEPSSSRGPTIDGRVKPDIAGFDNVSSNLTDLNPFFGTSAAAPHVAGAAALVAGANPAMDAAQMQDFLERRAGTSPPNNQLGHGVLNLGDPSDVEPPAGSGYMPLASPRRILDTRQTGGPLGARDTVTVPVPGLPADATAVAINLTGIAQASTYLSAYPGGRAWPGTSNLNLAPTTDSPAAVFATVPLGANQTITVRNASGIANAVVDLLGYFAPGAAGKYGAVPAQRLLDTRTPIGGHREALGNGQTVRVQMPAGVPADANTSVIVNLTSAAQSGGGWLALSPDCSASTSTLNYVEGITRANLAVVKLDGSGTFCVYDAGGTTQVTVDLVGYLAPSGIASYVTLPSPVRIVDTRNGNGGRHGALGVQDTMTLQGAGIFDVPYSAVALMTGVVATASTTGSFLTIYAGATRPNVSTVNFTANRVVPNAAVINLSSGTATIYNDQGSVQTVVDLFGYFV